MMILWLRRLEIFISEYYWSEIIEVLVRLLIFILTLLLNEKLDPIGNLNLYFSPSK